MVGKYIWNLFIALDQLLNTVVFFGHPDETVSSRLGRTTGKERYFWVKPLRIVVDKMFFFDYVIDEKTGRKLGHCESSVIQLENHIREIYDYELWHWNKD